MEVGSFYTRPVKKKVFFCTKKTIKIFEKRGTSTPVRMRGSRVTKPLPERKAVRVVTGERSRPAQYEGSDGSR